MTKDGTENKINAREFQKEMLITESVENLPNFLPFFTIPLPVVAVTFLKLFLTKLESIIGLRLFLSIPEKIQLEKFESLGIHRKLNILQKLGIIHSYHSVIRSRDDEPKLYASQINLASDNTNNQYGYGRSLSSQDEAWGPAIGEAVERWCVENYMPPKPKTKRYTSRELESIYGYSVGQVAGFTDDFRRQKERYQITDNTEFLCVETHELRLDRRIPAPLQWFSFKQVREEIIFTKKEPMINPIITTGAAAGRTYEEALLGGLLECIERDAFMIHWLRKITPNHLDIDQWDTPNIRHIKNTIERYKLETHFLDLETDFPVKVIACVVIDRSGKGPAVTVDACAGMGVDWCIEKSFQGAVGLRTLVQKNAHKYSKKTNSINPATINIQSRMAWWGLAEQLPKINFFIQGPKIPLKNPIAVLDKAKQIDLIINHARQRGYDVFCADIAPSIIKTSLELQAVFVHLPQLQPLYLKEQEYAHHGDRLWHIPDELGLRTNTQDINNTPHPFA